MTDMAAIVVPRRADQQRVEQGATIGEAQPDGASTCTRNREHIDLVRDHRVAVCIHEGAHQAVPTPGRPDEEHEVLGLAHTCRPHSVLSRPAQRPERGSDGSVGFTVHGMHPIDV